MENVNITALNNRFQISDNFTYLLFHWREQAITPPTRPDRVTTEQQQKNEQNRCDCLSQTPWD